MPSTIHLYFHPHSIYGLDWERKRIFSSSIERKLLVKADFFFLVCIFFNLIARYIWILLWSVELSLRSKSWNYTWGLKLVPQSDEVHYSLNFTPGLTPMRWTSNIPHSWQSSCHSESDWQGLCAFIVWGRHHSLNSQAPCLNVKPDTTKQWFHWSQFSKVHSTFECHIWYLHRQL